MAKSIKFFSVLCLVTMFCVSCSDLFENENGTDGTVDDNDVYVQNPNAVDGALIGVFSVSEDKKVHFSQGNLQYKATTGKWRFAANQWDWLGENNRYTCADYYDWIDLFCWGTSGWNNGAREYQPYSVGERGDYKIGGSPNNDLTGEFVNADWGVYNKIVNGGDMAGLWRTLSYDEWYYLLYQRSNAENLVFVAEVDTILGIVLLPDDWQTSTIISFTQNEASYESYTFEQWERLEEKGGVFLPNAGWRAGLCYWHYPDDLSYWTTSIDGDEGARTVYMDVATYVVRMGGLYRDSGASVRLVQDIQ